MRNMIAFLLALGFAADAAASERVTLTAACAVDNDLFRVLLENRIARTRFDSAGEAVRAAETGSGVLILADSYPNETTTIDPTLLEKAAEKNLRLYVEYRPALPGIEVDRPISTHTERVVVHSDLFGDRLRRLRIVSVNGLHYVPVKAERAHLVAARVAGFDHALYGLPPILFEMPGGNVLVATTKLSAWGEKSQPNSNIRRYSGPPTFGGSSERVSCPMSCRF